MTLSLIDSGIPNNPATGDTLYKGANKINSVLTDFYDRFTNQDIDILLSDKKIHVDGYYKKLAATAVIDSGAKYDVDTSTGAIELLTPAAVIGESFVIRTLNDSWVTNSLTVSSSTATINGLSSVEFNLSNVELKFTCTNTNEWNVTSISFGEISLNTVYTFGAIAQFANEVISIPASMFDTMLLQVVAVDEVTVAVASSNVIITHNMNYTGVDVFIEEDPILITDNIPRYSITAAANGSNVDITIESLINIDKLKVKILSSLKL